jgi:hypothetical protein
VVAVTRPPSTARSALRNGAPFEDLPARLQTLRRSLLRNPALLPDSRQGWQTTRNHLGRPAPNDLRIGNWH